MMIAIIRNIYSVFPFGFFILKLNTKRNAIRRVIPVKIQCMIVVGNSLENAYTKGKKNDTVVTGRPV